MATVPGKNDSSDPAIESVSTTAAAHDEESLELLRQIFPDETDAALHDMHEQRVLRRHIATARKSTSQSRRRRRRYFNGRAATVLPHDFLRLPPHHAIRRFNEQRECWSYELVSRLQAHVLAQYSDAEVCKTHVLFRDDQHGLGMTLALDKHGVVRVQALRHPPSKTSAYQGKSKPSLTFSGSPAYTAGLRVGDELIGVNERPITALQIYELAESHIHADNARQRLYNAVQLIRLSPDPVVLHVIPCYDVLSVPLTLSPMRPLAAAMLHTPPRLVLQLPNDAPSLLDQTHLDSSRDNDSDIQSCRSDDELSFVQCRVGPSTPQRIFDASNPAHLIPPVVRALAQRGLVALDEREQFAVSQDWHQFTARTRQWEALGSFHLTSHSESGRNDHDVVIPLYGVRKTLCVRIVHWYSANEGRNDNIVYTMWVYDVEAGHEWFAPKRTLQDFVDLRRAVSRLAPDTIRALPFPALPGRSLLSFAGPLGSPRLAETTVGRQSRHEHDLVPRKLERFVRELASLIYTAPLHAETAAIAAHLQSFLGCEAALSEQKLSPKSWCSSRRPEKQHERIREMLKRGLQRFCYRLLLLDPVDATIDQFVESVRDQAPLRSDIEALEAQGIAVLQHRAVLDIEQMQVFLDHLQDILVDSCQDDFRSIADRDEYALLHPLLRHERGTTSYWEKLMHEAVREQLEIEVYVPLRGIMSRWLVHGWRHEDMDLQARMKDVRPRGLSFFQIESELEVGKAADWLSVAAILRQGVGQSTLPCAKLRAIVDAACQVQRVFDKFTSQVEEKCDVAGHSLGADQFLPVFIYCVVHAELERPAALCVLLRTLCDRRNRTGETGYYLASLEAALAHLSDLDVHVRLCPDSTAEGLDKQSPDEMASFHSVPLHDH